MNRKSISDAVKAFNGRVNQALNGKNAAADIQRAVWAMLKDLGIDTPNMAREE